MRLASKKISLLQICRTIIQILSLIILPELYINAFAGIKEIYSGIINQSFNFAQSIPQLVELIAIIPCTILIGRFFCGWLCAFGTICDIIYKISSRFLKISFRMNSKADKILKYVKYVVLVLIIMIFWSFGKNYSSANPWETFGVLFGFRHLPDFSYAFSKYTAGFLILIAVFAASMLIERFFCRYLCPLGAIFTLLSKLRLTKIVKPSSECGNCRICTKTCAMGIDLYNKESTSSGECINCLKCISDCPRKNVSISYAGEYIRPAATVTLAVILITVTYLSGLLLTDNSINISSTEITAINDTLSGSGNYTDGTYEGSGTGFRGRTTTVSVTVSDGQISDIQIISYGDDARWFNRAYNSVVSQILSTQSAQVDAVSGATYSSYGIMEAVQNALQQSIVQK